MTPNTPADGALAEAIAELRRVTPAGIPWGSKDLFAGPPDRPVPWCPAEIATILNAVLSGALIPRPAEPAQAAQVDANQRRADAATLLLDMLYMRNGAHEGLDRDAVEKMWNAVREDDGFPSVVQFLSLIADAQEGRE